MAQKGVELGLGIIATSADKIKTNFVRALQHPHSEKEKSTFATFVKTLGILRGNWRGKLGYVLGGWGVQVFFLVLLEVENIYFL